MLTRHPTDEKLKPSRSTMSPGKNQPTYTVQVPGVSDFFKLPLPGLDNPELQKERIKRMRKAKSPLPDALKYVPWWLNQLDDAQDLLYTAYFLGRPLLKRLPSKTIPVLGWGLLVSDALNMMTNLLGFALIPAMVKIGIPHWGIHGRTWIRKSIVRYDDFIKSHHPGYYIIGVVQAAQAAYTLTGYGLVLGPAMAAISDTFWGAYRSATGKAVIIQGPPPSDPVGKAVRLLMQPPWDALSPESFSYADHELMLSARRVGISLLRDHSDEVLQPEKRGLPPLTPADRQRIKAARDARINAMPESQIPAFVPWNEYSREALVHEGFHIDPTDPLKALEYHNLSLYHQMMKKVWQGLRTWNRYHRCLDPKRLGWFCEMNPSHKQRGMVYCRGIIPEKFPYILSSPPAVIEISEEEGRRLQIEQAHKGAASLFFRPPPGW